MPPIVCPGCGSDLEHDLLESTGKAECPFCGADVPELLSFSPTEGNGDSTAPLPLLPEKSLIEVIEATPQRRVFYIHGGWSCGIAFFAIFWNLITGVVSGGFLFGMFAGDGFPGGWPIRIGIFAFFSIFWAVGIGMIVWWVKSAFERLFVMIEPDRVVIQRTLFGYKRIAETTLDDSSRAELIESYSENDNPVYRIEITGIDRTAKFGTALSPEEKDWLVDQINEFLRPTGEPPSAQPRPDFCFNCGAKLNIAAEASSTTCPACGQEINIGSGGDDRQESSPEDAAVPQPPELVIDVQTDDHLQFHLPGCSHPIVRWGLGLFSMTFGIAFVSAPLGTALNFDDLGILPLLFTIPFILGGLIPIAVGLFMLCGRITVALSPGGIRVRYHVGPLGYSKTAVLDAIIRVHVAQSKPSNPRVGRGAHQSGTKNLDACIVQAGKKSLLLTLVHDRSTARFVAQLVREQLKTMGHELPQHP